MFYRKSSSAFNMFIFWVETGWSCFKRENERVRGRNGFFIKHESFRIFRDLKLSWRQLFQIKFGFLNWHGFIKGVQGTENSCTGFSKNSLEKLYFLQNPMFWMWKLFQWQFTALNNFFKRPHFKSHEFLRFLGLNDQIFQKQKKMGFLLNQQFW